MSKWEYKSIKIEGKGWFIGGEIDQNKFEAEINQMGNEEWELVSVFDTNTTQGATRYIVGIFKRPKRDFQNDGK